MKKLQKEGEKMDLIERQAAIDKFKPWLNVKGYSEGELNMLKAILYELRSLPSAQPEIIRCRDCKHSEHWYRDKRRCFLWHEAGIDVFEDGYCNYAERREDG